MEREIGGLMIWALSYDNTSEGQELVQSIEENYLKVISPIHNISPSKFKLNTFPNPFNPVCNIDLNIEIDQNIRITVSDLTGLQKDIINQGFVKSGHHNLQLDMSNYPSGVYFIKAESNYGIKTKKVTLLK